MTERGRRRDFWQWLLFESGAYQAGPPGMIPDGAVLDLAISEPMEPHATVVFRRPGNTFHPDTKAQDGDVRVGFVVRATGADGLTQVYITDRAAELPYHRPQS